MKKLLALLLLSPLAFAESKVLELTCESAFPFCLTYDFDTEEGFLIHPDNLNAIDGTLTKSITQSKGKQPIKELIIKGDYYVIYQKGNFSLNGAHHIYVNRKNLHFWVQTNTGGNKTFSGVCSLGINKLPDYQI